MQQKQAFLDSLSHKLADLLKDSPAKDLEANLKAGLSGFLSKLDLVTREEFDVQAEVLQRTKTELSVLESRLAELEKRFSPSPTQD
jgi:hypothetical protein